MSAEGSHADSCRVSMARTWMWLLTWDPRTCACIAVAAFASSASQPSMPLLLVVLIGCKPREGCRRNSGTRCDITAAPQAYPQERRAQLPKRRINHGETLRVLTLALERD